MKRFDPTSHHPALGPWGPGVPWGLGRPGRVCPSSLGMRRSSAALRPPPRDPEGPHEAGASRLAVVGGNGWDGNGWFYDQQ